MDRRRLLMLQQKQEGLPSGYTAVNYLQASGTQYIDVGLTLTQDSTVWIDICFVEKKLGAIFGGLEADDKRNFSSFILEIDSKIYFSFGNTRNRVGEPYDLARHTYEISKAGVKKDGNTIFTFLPVSDFETPNTLLFNIGRGADGSGRDKALSAQVYGYKVYKNEEFVANMYPCLDEKGTPCFYDIVRERPYYNAGTGSFTWG